MPTTSHPTSKQLDRIESAIIGNGQEGLLARTARIEEKLKSSEELAKEAKENAEKAAGIAEDAVSKATEALGKLTTSVALLEQLIKTHIGTDHLSVLMKKKQFWVLVVVGFITLHIIATYIPNLWDLIVIMLGIPKLAIPIVH